MKLKIQDIGDGLNLSFHLDRQELDALLDIEGNELSGTDPGMDVHVLAQMVEDTILVRGDVSAKVAYVCARCAEPAEREVTAVVDAALVPEPAASTLEPELELAADDLDVAYYSGEEVDLAPIVREALLLELPSYPACLDTEACDEAMKALPAVQTEEEVKDKLDPRWAALKAIRDQMDS